MSVSVRDVYVHVNVYVHVYCLVLAHGVHVLAAVLPSVRYPSTNVDDVAQPKSEREPERKSQLHKKTHTHQKKTQKERTQASPRQLNSMLLLARCQREKRSVDVKKKSSPLLQHHYVVVEEQEWKK